MLEDTMLEAVQQICDYLNKDMGLTILDRKKLLAAVAQAGLKFSVAPTRPMTVILSMPHLRGGGPELYLVEASSRDDAIIQAWTMYREFTVEEARQDFKTRAHWAYVFDGHLSPIS